MIQQHISTAHPRLLYLSSTAENPTEAFRPGGSRDHCAHPNLIFIAGFRATPMADYLAVRADLLSPRDHLKS